jgi:hypothetical protein
MKLAMDITSNILSYLSKQIYKNPYEILQQIISTNNRELDLIVDKYNKDNEDLFYINDFVRKKYSVPTQDKIRLDFHRIGVIDYYIKLARETFYEMLYHIRDFNKMQARSFSVDIERLSDKKFDKRSKSDSIINTGKDIISKLKETQANIAKYGNYPYLQEYYNKYNEALKTPLFEKRMKLALKK